MFISFRIPCHVACDYYHARSHAAKNQCVFRHMNTTLNEYRCDCGKLLFKGALSVCTLEIKCKKCAKVVSFTFNAI